MAFCSPCRVGDKVEASAWLGQVDENFQPLKIMVPFTQKGVCTVKSIVPEGDYKIEVWLPFWWTKKEIPLK